MKLEISEVLSQTFMKLTGIPENTPAAQSVKTTIQFIRTAEEIFKSMDARFAGMGLSRGKIMMLCILYADTNRSLLPSELADRAQVTRGTITGLVDGLESEGWVKRIHDAKDRRRTSVQLTEKGMRFVEQNVEGYVGLMIALTSKFNEDDFVKMQELISKLRAGFEVSSQLEI